MGCTQVENRMIAGGGASEIESLWGSLREQVETALNLRGQSAALSRLCPPKGVADDVLKLLVTAEAQGRVAVLRVSPEAFPEIVANELAVARRAREMLGEELGSVILDPLLAGRINGRTFAVLPYCPPLSESRLVWAMQRWWLGPGVLNWLRRVTAATLEPTTEEQVERDFRRPLDFMAGNDRLADRIRQEASNSLQRLGEGVWHPRYVLAHNDLWKGNILLSRRACPRGGATGGFGGIVVIDWGAALLQGHAIYDLVHLGHSLNLSRQRWWKELTGHCQILGTDMAGAKAYLLAALGYLGMHLGQCPIDRYLACVESCYGVLTELEGVTHGC